MIRAQRFALSQWLASLAMQPTWGNKVQRTQASKPLTKALRALANALSNSSASKPYELASLTIKATWGNKVKRTHASKQFENSYYGRYQASSYEGEASAPPPKKNILQEKNESLRML